MRGVFNREQAQSTLEYVIIWTAIVAAVLLAAKTAVQPAVQETIEKTSEKLTKDAARLLEESGSQNN